jgi:hypothetical protein
MVNDNTDDRGFKKQSEMIMHQMEDERKEEMTEITQTQGLFSESKIAWSSTTWGLVKILGHAYRNRELDISPCRKNELGHPKGKLRGR